MQPSEHAGRAGRETRINEAIQAREVRLITESGEQMGVMPLSQALQIARAHEADLVEVAANAVPPVCRLLNYDRFRYEQARRERLARKHQKATLVKEIRLRPKIDIHDIDTKVRQAEKHLADGDKIKLSVLYRGREMTHMDRGRDVLLKVVEALKGVATIERPATMEGRQLSLIMTPSAKGKAQRQTEET